MADTPNNFTYNELFSSSPWPQCQFSPLAEYLEYQLTLQRLLKFLL